MVSDVIFQRKKVKCGRGRTKGKALRSNKQEKWFRSWRWTCWLGNWEKLMSPGLPGPNFGWLAQETHEFVQRKIHGFTFLQFSGVIPDWSDLRRTLTRWNPAFSEATALKKRFIEKLPLRTAILTPTAVEAGRGVWAGGLHVHVTSPHTFPFVVPWGDLTLV